MRIKPTMFSRTEQHALAAMKYLAEHEDQWPVPAGRIARETGIPHRYLSRILGALVRAGVLRSARGTGGGFRMVRRPQSVRLCEVLAPFEGHVALRHASASDDPSHSRSDPCAGNGRWEQVKRNYLRFLRGTSIDDITQSAHQARAQKKMQRKQE